MWRRTLSYSPYNKDEDFPEGLLLAQDFCLSPDGGDPWCYQKNKKQHRHKCLIIYCGN